ncbi:MAG: response regulator transcription factor [Proteobacteria bacterium]|nr:response regulator transcription factor [Pseudomonadota bacterium]
MRILLVEDDRLLGDGIQAGLSQAGFGVDWAKNCDEGRLAVATSTYSCLVLDIGLPDGSGLDLLLELRNANNPLPVLVLTARDTLADRVKGLDKGADDYLVKPFELDELTARVRALLRRSYQRTSPVICCKGLVLDPATRKVTLDGNLVELPLREFTLLEELLENQGRVLTRAQLEQSLYGWNAEVESNAIEVHVHHLRKKFGSDFIKTIRGVGYVINKAQGK